MRTVISVLVGIVVIGGLIYLFNQPADDYPDQNVGNQDYEQTQTPETDNLETFTTIIGGEVTAVLQHPSTTTILQVQDTILEVKYIGPNSEPNTEITDGFYASLTFEETGDITQYAQTQNPIASISSTTFEGQAAITFETEPVLGTEPNTHVAYRLPDINDWIVNITYSTYGERSDEYREELLQILGSLMTYRSTPPETTTLEIAVLDYDGIPPESSGPMRGCDRVVFITETIPETTMPLTAALEKLFSYTETEIGDWQNFIAKTKDTLSFERATVEDGVASIYLTGELSGLAGVCDNPRARIQIEETALQFETVDAVTLYLNSEETELQPSDRGE